MDFNATIDLIIKDLEEARVIIDDLGKYKGVPLIQVELAKSKCKTAADVIALLKKMDLNQTSDKPAVSEIPDQQQVPEAKTIQPEAKPVHHQIPEVKTEPVQQPVPEMKFVQQQPEIRNEREEPKHHEEEIFEPGWHDEVPHELPPQYKPDNESIFEKKPEQEVHSEDSSVKKARSKVIREESEIKAPAPNNEIKAPIPTNDIKAPEPELIKKTIIIQKEIKEDSVKSVQTGNEIKSSTGKTTETVIIADRFIHQTTGFNKKRVSSLGEAIGINDSFYFIREIFNGNKVSYNEALLKLEKAESLNDAESILAAYLSSTSDYEAVKQLLSLVKQKLLLNE